MNVTAATTGLVGGWLPRLPANEGDRRPLGDLGKALRIDHVAVRGMTIDSVSAQRLAVSDHCALIAALSWAELLVTGVLVACGDIPVGDCAVAVKIDESCCGRRRCRCEMRLATVGELTTG